jgi:hypothetical protein
MFTHIMAEADPLQRIKSAAHRSEGPISVETQRQRHFAALDLDLGLDAETKRRRELANRPSRLPSLTRVIGYIMLFCLFLVAAMTIRLWYDGALGRFVIANMPKAPSEKGWMLSRDVAISADTVDAVDGAANAATSLPSLVEPLPVPPPQAEASEESEEGGVDEEG